MTEQVHLATEPMYGWREWKIVRKGLFRWRLQAIAGDYVWTSGWQKAHCNLHLSFHRPADPACTCGFWSLAERSDFSFWKYGRKHAFGKIEMAGRVVEGWRGWRSEHARITATITIIASEKDRLARLRARSLSKYYGVPVEIVVGEPWFDHHHPIWPFTTAAILASTGPSFGMLINKIFDTGNGSILGIAMGCAGLLLSLLYLIRFIIRT